jgi:hypothetical protein
MSSLEISLVCGAAAGTIVTVAVLTVGITDLEPLGIIYTLVYALVTALAVTSVMLAATDFHSRGSLSVDFLTEDLRTGALGLRISTAIVAGKSLAIVLDSLAFQEFQYGGPLNWLRKLVGGKRLFGREHEFPELSGIPALRDTETTDWYIVSQYGFYVGVVTLLWLLTSLNDGGTWVLVLSWAFFFVVDDWSIISSYMYHLGGRIFRWHALRIEVFNVVIAVAVSVLVWQHFSWKGIVISTAILAIMGLWHSLAFLEVNIPKSSDAFSAPGAGGSD